jgi:arabinofuranan 3-O-arabinosyltransferase
MSAPVAVPAPNLSADQDYRRVAFAICAACLLPIWLYYRANFEIVEWPLDTQDMVAGRDFVNLWSGGRAAWSGRYDLLFDVRKHMAEITRLIHADVHPNGWMWSYPPTAFWLGMPFALFNYSTAIVLWWMAGLAAYLAAFSFGGARAASRSWLPWICIAPGTLFPLFFGQTSLLLSAVLIVGLLLAGSRPVLAGALLGLLVVKPHIAMLVPVILIAQRQGRAFVATGVFAALYLALTLGAFGLEPWEKFFTVTVPGMMNVHMLGDFFFTDLGIAPHYMLRRLSVPTSAAIQIQWVLAAATAAWLLWLLPRIDDQDLRLSVAAAASLFASPYMIHYELALLSLASFRALAYLPEAAEHWRAARKRIGFIGLAAPVIALYLSAAINVNVAPLMMLAVMGIATVAVPGRGRTQFAMTPARGG